MTQYDSDIKTISSSEEVVFGILSDFNNLSRLKDINQENDKIKELETATDNCSFVVSELGKINLHIIEREPNQRIKIQIGGIPIEAFMQINLSELANGDTQLKISMFTEIPSIMKMMLEKKLKDGLNTLADLMVKALED